MADTIEKQMTVPNDTAYLAEIRQTVLEMIGGNFFPQGQAQLVALAVDEAVANVMEHAYENAPDNGSGDQLVEIKICRTDRKFEVIILDKGQRFDPHTVPDVDIEDHVRKGRKGGLGIFLIRRIMDEVNYSFKKGVHNELQLVKYVDNSSGAAKSGQTSASKRSP
jgi:serine/threonine-protein kinase RsbW